MTLETILTLVLIIVVFANACLYFASAKKIPLNQLHLPTISPYTGFLSSICNFMFAFWDINSMISLGYEKYSKFQVPFILPALQTHIVLLPISSIKWLVDQPGHILSAQEMQKDILQTDLTLLDASLQENPVHLSVIRRDLTRGIDSLIPDLEDELTAAIDECWGVDAEEWVEVGIFDSMMRIISRTSNRVFVGLPLCRDQNYLSNAASFAQDIAISAAIIRLLPAFLKPILSWPILLPNKYHFAQCAKHLIPLINSRIKVSSHLEVEANHHGIVPDWFIREAQRQSQTSHPNVPSDEQTPSKIARRTMSLNFASIHTTTFTAVNLLFDLYCSPTTSHSIPILRQEISNVYATASEKWDKSSLAKLVKTDSALRESMRISTFLTHGLNRLVVASDGVMTNDGLYLPFGTKIGTSSYAIHHDEDVYPLAEMFLPFRFSQTRDEAAADDANVNSNPGLAVAASDHKPANLNAVTTSEIFLPFGHGKHACPGRFFATTEIKIMIAYIIMNYDIQPRAERPKNRCVGQTIIPPLREGLVVKRKKLI